jgi:hypothetical protein
VAKLGEGKTEIILSIWGFSFMVKYKLAIRQTCFGFYERRGKHVNTTIILELDKYLYPGSNIYFLAQFVLLVL